jgi:hypothetical protein
VIALNRRVSGGEHFLFRKLALHFSEIKIAVFGNALLSGMLSARNHELYVFWLIQAWKGTTDMRKIFQLKAH